MSLYHDSRLGIAITGFAISAFLLVLVLVEVDTKNAESLLATPVSEVPLLKVREGQSHLLEDGPSQWQRDSLQLLAVYGNEEDFGKIKAMQPMGSLLVVGDSYISPHIAVIDLDLGQVVARVGTHGEGPTEFQSPGSITSALHRDSAVWVHDFYNRRISLVKLDEEGRRPRIGDVIPLLVGTTTEYPILMGDGIISAGLYGEEAVLVSFDLTGRPLGRFGQPPFTMADVGHPIGVRLVNRSALTTNLDRTKLAVSYYSANRVDIFSTEGQLLASARGPRDIEASFYVEDGRFFWDVDKNQLAYTSITASADAVYALFCGCGMMDELPTDRTRIHVFSWNGRFQRELLLPHAVKRIAISADGRRLFTAVDDPWPRVLEWRIPSRD